ncbi:signal peptide peptidase SppA [Eisenibacter elegans]|uniref:signal peptide peptidase SppA n=1 Tax=Eisenibacter elegans TaxID=997 RepID=UPI00042894F7|nr:signal peptide peptidase SppA [Eisenibacter elegans]
MLKFLRLTFALMAAIAFLITIGSLLFLGIAQWALSEKKVTVKDNSILKIELKRALIERDNDDNITALLTGPQGSGIGLLELCKKIRQAAQDPKIKIIYLKVSDLQGGFASFSELRLALLDFKAAGKHIVTYGEFYGQKAYYLASVADHILLTPEGGFDFRGLSAEQTFFKGSLEKLGIQPEVFRVGEFKSAVEPFMLRKMSDENRLQTSALLESIYGHYLEVVGQSRNIGVETLRQLADSMAIRNPEDALKHKLVTQLAYQDEVEPLLRQLLKIEDEKKELPWLTYEDYLKVENNNAPKISGKDRIAVVFASGDIVGGKSNENQTIGSETIVRTLRKLRKDENCKAIVLRINSPGGSALASDVMWREINLAAQEKPVIASMSDAAASGGYYMAMACTKIVAQPTTLTGSIGVFGVSFTLESFLEDKLGITTDRVNTGPYADLGNPLRQLSPAERQIIQNSVEQTYQTFTSKAAQGRKMSVEELQKVAGGRVWTGLQAKELNLVDELGTLDDAIALAAQEAKLEANTYRVRYYPDQPDFFERLRNQGLMGQMAKTPTLPADLKEAQYYFLLLEQLKKTEPIQARMPFYLEIR